MPDDEIKKNGGRKFYLLKAGVLKTFWFSLIATFTLQAGKYLLEAFTSVKLIDTEVVWTYLTVVTITAVSGIFLYAGVNVIQHLGILKLNGKK